MPERVTSEAEVARLVERALVAIDDDAPDYGEPLHALAASPFALTLLAAQPALGQALFVELRKLRPLTLWVHDRVDRALAAKRDAVLDGAICTLGSDMVPLRPEGRECWLEADATAAETTLRGLPSGWGLVVTGDLRAVSFAALRRASPLRALGARLLDPTHAPDTRLDLVIVPEDAEPGTEEGRGARVLWSVSSADALRLPPGPSPSLGVLCDGKSAFACALRLATLRTA